MSPHRVSLLRPALRRHPDPTRSRDPRVAAVVAGLREIELPEPRPDFRAELRAQLVAITPRIVAEGSGDPTLATRPRPRPRPTPIAAPAVAAAQPVRRETGPSFWTKLRAVPIGRPLGVAASLVVVLAMVLGGAVWMSRDSVPGDALYGLKRASERVELAVASNDAERAQDHLDFAAERVREARELVGRPASAAAGTGPLADGGISVESARRIAEALRDADADTRTASQLLGGLAVRTSSDNPLSTMTNWAPDQLGRLKALWAAMPETGSLRDTATRSTTLVTAADRRATSLKKSVDCTDRGNTRSDSLGPMPSAGCQAKTSGGPKSSTPGGTKTKKKPAGTRTSTRGSSGAGSTRPTTIPPGIGKSGSVKTPKLPLPTGALPSGKRSVPPLTVGSCVNVLDILKIGKCSSKTP